jgi:fatty-acyl-CoA synthase
VLHDAGLRPGDVVALLTENNLRAFEVYWAAMRSGLYITAVNWHLKPDEIAYIVNDSGATALIVSAGQAPAAEAISGLTTGVKLRLAFGGQVKGYGGYEDTIAGRVGRAVRRPAERFDHAVLLGHHGPAQGRPAVAARPPGDRAR